jgi:hypothetical protein
LVRFVVVQICGSPPAKAVTRSIVAPHLAAANGLPTPGQTTIKKGLVAGQLRSRIALLAWRLVEPMTGIEPAYSAWEADVLPLNYIGLTSCAGDHEG